MAAENGPRPRILRFATFEVDLQARELRKNGLKLKLHGQPFDVLTMLLERPGEVVNREQLRERLWPTETFVDFDHGVNTAINRLREALGDSADNPRFIETLPRRGYRFIAPIESIPPVPAVSAPATSATSKAQAAPSPVTAVQPGKGMRFVWVLAAAVLLGLLVAADRTDLLRRLSSDQPRTPIQSIAVLPLVNLSNDVNQDYFADGMTEALITDLGQISALRVISRTSVMKYKDTQKSLPEIAHELNVDALIEGTVLRSGNHLRITANLLQASPEMHLWGQTYERDLGDVLMLQNEVAQSIAERIHVRLNPQEQSRMGSARVVNPDAYQAYLRGRFYETVTDTRTGIKRAQSYYKDAVQKDPKFALAYVGLADSSLELGTLRLIPPQESFQQGSEAIHKALQLDPTLGEAYTSLGMLDWQFAWNWVTAETEMRHGVSLNPGYIEGHETLVWYLSWAGRGAEALGEVDKMRQLDPANPFLPLQASGVYYHQRDYKSLVESGAKSVAAYPNLWATHYFLAVGYEGTSRPAQAIPEYRRAVELSEADSDGMAGLAHAYVAAGRRTEAEKILRQLETQSKSEYVSPYMIAVIYAGLGKNDQAFEFLEKAYNEKSPDVAYFLRADLRVDSLRSDPHFQSLLRKMNFPQ